MRTLISQAIAPAGSASGFTWFPGLPHVAAALATWPVFGASATVSGILLASLVSFVVWLPLTAIALNGGRALSPDAPGPTLTVPAKLALFALWTATVWAAAAIAR